MIWFIGIVYALSLLYIFLFSLSQLHLTYVYVRHKSQREEAANVNKFEPTVTVQLPVYNEKYVIERLLIAISNLDYPKHKLEIQILDDSTDETTAIIIQCLEKLRPLQLDFQLIHRENRSGFKAGALENGLKSAKGEFIAIFDADFIPETSFLTRTIHHFNDINVGAIQTRWEYTNKDYSLLTQLQAFGLNAHFSIEQIARNASGSFINFNGTCGIWRKECIITSGGWQADTLTEDLDLSYRAQLKGWRFRFLEEVGTPGELPIHISAVKSQQYRWNKGGAETARKLFGKVLQSNLNLKQKVHAFFHLFNSGIFLSVLIAALLSVPMLLIKNENTYIESIFSYGSFFMVGFLSIGIFYFTSTRRFYKKPALEFAKLFPAFLILSIGLSLHSGLAVLQGYLGVKSPFKRTPKLNITSAKHLVTPSPYIQSKLTLVTAGELILCIYFTFGVLTGLQLQDYTLIIFHVILSFGFGLIAYLSIKELFHV